MTNFEQGQIYRHPAFEGLRDEEVVSVYNIASLKKINTGDILVKEGGTDTPAYLILEGSAKVQRSLKGRAIQIGVVRQGDWVPRALFFEKGRRTDSVIALESLTVLVLDEASFNVLSPKIQLAIYKNLSKLSVQL